MRFFKVSGKDDLVLRSDGAGTDEAFLDGEWQPTKLIIDYKFGHDDNVEPITETTARRMQPAAFN